MWLASLWQIMSAFSRGPDGAQENVMNSSIWIFSRCGVWEYNVASTQWDLWANRALQSGVQHWATQAMGRESTVADIKLLLYSRWGARWHSSTKLLSFLPVSLWICTLKLTFLTHTHKKKERGGGREGRKSFNNYAGNYMMLKLCCVLLFQWRDFLQYCALQRL